MAKGGDDVFSMISSFAQSLGEALGDGVARGIQAGLMNAGMGGGSGRARSTSTRGASGRRPGRPPSGSSKLCSVEGCGKPARSKGLCSAHYQAERRKKMPKAA